MSRFDHGSNLSDRQNQRIFTNRVAAFGNVDMSSDTAIDHSRIRALAERAGLATPGRPMPPCLIDFAQLIAADCVAGLAQAQAISSTSYLQPTQGVEVPQLH